jgi:hypothetical protein
VALKFQTLFVMVTLCTSFECHAQDVSAAKEFTFQEIFATRKDDAREYILLGSGWLRAIQFGNPSDFISSWLAAHPSATVRQVSRMGMTNTVSKRTEELVYIWVEDGEMSLNVDLVRAGIFPSGVMADMVDNYNGLTELFKKPELAFAREQFEKGPAEAPQDQPQRLISEDEYKQFADRVVAAENQAREEKAGIWSDAMKDERESEGYP